MDWSKDKSLRLSQACLLLFALLLLILDLGCGWWTERFVAWRLIDASLRGWFIASFLASSVFAWVALLRLWRLIANIRRAMVFTDANVAHLRVVSWCCVGVALVCLASCAYYLEFLFVVAAAGFMALIVRIVKNVFEQAITMKSELDLTI